MPAITPSTSSIIPATRRRRPRCMCRKKGVVFTGDNVFHKCRSWLQECDPWEWLDALDRIAALDVEVIVAGHGEPCSKADLKEQAQIVENCVGFVERHIERGASHEEILQEGVTITAEDTCASG